MDGKILGPVVKSIYASFEGRETNVEQSKLLT